MTKNIISYHLHGAEIRRHGNSRLSKRTCIDARTGQAHTRAQIHYTADNAQSISQSINQCINHSIKTHLHISICHRGA